MAKKETYLIPTLVGYKRISNSKGELDLVEEQRKRTVSIDPDGKRGFDVLPDGSISPITLPHPDMKSALVQRQAVESIRKRGVEATPELIHEETKILGKSIRLVGGDAVTLARMSARGFTQGRITTCQALPSDKVLAEIFNRVWSDMKLTDVCPMVWKADHFKNARHHGRWEPGVMTINPAHEGLVEQLCAAVHADLDQAKRLLFIPDAYVDATFPLLEQVVRAVLQGPMLGIYPFPLLQRFGFLPGRDRIVEAFPQLTELHFAAYLSKLYHPGELQAYDYPKLCHIFYQLGLPWRYSQKCARVIAPHATKSSKNKQNPARKTCLEVFVTALHQLNVAQCQVPAKRILDRLQRYGLSEKRYYALRREKLILGALRDTSANRWQLRNMAKSLGLEPSAFDTLLAGRN